jgi:peptidoglycan/LPS O-acetylase OafA/YrhL
MMKGFKDEIIKYMLLLLGIVIIDLLLNLFLIRILDFHQFDDPGKAYHLFYKMALFIMNLLFGLILFLDYRKEMKSRYLIPILGAIVPIVGLMFYFIEKYTLSKVDENDK